MPEPILCKICGKRRARRACPAVQGDICPICCGTEREVSLSCPLECEYLQEAHRHEKPVAVAEDEIAYPDVEVSEAFVRRHEELVLFCVYALLQAAVRTSGAVDSDVLAALEALIQTYRTAESGLIYESRPDNLVALGVQRSFNTSLEEYQKMKSEREPLSAPRTSDILRTLVFLHRLGQQHRNDRPRGRMFLDLLRQMTPESVPDQTAPSLII
ncbi:MAG TPA: hypothetical protein VKX25_14625 [Bryobacteraceae bacterium]|jgi:hypothetical protein|nr:hypothetical protein [Bryobacteraceae bacterium]